MIRILFGEQSEDRLLRGEIGLRDEVATAFRLPGRAGLQAVEDDLGGGVGAGTRDVSGCLAASGAW